MLTSMLFLMVAGVGAEVVDGSATHFVVRNTFRVSASAENAYKALVEDVDKWWHPDHTWSGNPKKLSIDEEAGGCFCEELEHGGSVEHMRVIHVDRGKLFRMSGALGPLQEMAVAGTLTFTFEESDAGTEIVLEYRVFGHHAEGVEALAPAVDEVLKLQLSRLGAYVEGK